MRYLTALLFLLATTVAGADTTITYQGQLQDGSGPVDDIVDMSFALFDDEAGGSQVGATISLTGVSVVGGLFQVDLDFGQQPYASGLWLAIEVEEEPLMPRQAITGAPFAISVAPGSGSNWEISGSDIHFSGGNVGISTSSPSVALDVIGSAKFGNPKNTVGDNSTFSFVGGGRNNNAESNFSFVGGGQNNTASGFDSFVAGGVNNTAGAARTFAAGTGAKAEHSGTFVWADNTTGTFASTGVNQFLIRADGGVGIGTNKPERDLHIKANNNSAALILENASGVDGWGIGTSTSNGDFHFYYESDVDEFSTIGTLLGSISNSTGEYSSNSDRRLKQDIEALEGVLTDVLKLEPTRYRFRRSGDNGQRTIGFLAQDVQKVFPELVTNGDLDGYLGLSYANFSVLAIGAIQEQQAIIEAQQARMSEGERRLGQLEAENAELRELAKHNANLEVRLATLESLLLKDRQLAEQSQCNNNKPCCRH